MLESITLWNIILSVILTPILETWLFQYLPIEFFKTYYNKTWQLTLISGIPFGLLHYFNQYLLRDAVYGVVIGVAFAYVYILAKKRKDINPVLATALVHAGYNLSGVVVRVVFA
ncbi:MAG TPA: CPBP family intramembrane glutamic endopeptidase [Membranihabitans sp.]|nr:CPBP family intramembrane glutamic endopeptidase [Membranihabitans sp.]